MPGIWGRAKSKGSVFKRLGSEQAEHTPSAIEEFLRYDTSSQMTSRIAAEDCEMNGTFIRRGQTLNLLLGSGNHDPEAFTDPDRLNITRAEKPHLSFGMGMHYCLGAPLARYHLLPRPAAPAARHLTYISPNLWMICPFVHGLSTGS
jgi:cytochrome P450